MSLFVIVHGAWGSPDEMAPVRAPLLVAGHDVIAVDLPCTTPDATPDSSLVDTFLGSEPFTDEPDVDIEALVSENDPAEQETNRQYLLATQRSQGIAAMHEKWDGKLPTERSITYVLTTADTLLPPNDPRAMAEAWGATIIEIDSDHSSFGEQPEQLAQILASCAPA